MKEGVYWDGKERQNAENRIIICLDICSFFLGFLHLICSNQTVFVLYYLIMALAEHHIETIFKLFKYEIGQEYRTIILRGSDQVNIQANNLWMFSSLIRALIGSSVSANEELIIILLPDHYGHDISAALNVLNTSQIDDIVFSENVKDILYDLGMNFANLQIN